MANEGVDAVLRLKIPKLHEGILRGRNQHALRLEQLALLDGALVPTQTIEARLVHNIP